MDAVKVIKIWVYMFKKPHNSRKIDQPFKNFQSQNKDHSTQTFYTIVHTITNAYIKLLYYFKLTIRPLSVR